MGHSLPWSHKREWCAASSHTIPSGKSYVYSRGGQMIAQQFVKHLSTLLWEEDAGALQLDRLLRSRYRLAEPVRPFYRKVDIIGAPDDESRRLQRFQLRLDRECMLVIERCHEALE